MQIIETILFKTAKKSSIDIKPSHKGRFTEYCGGTVSESCIETGIDSPDPKIRQEANFARNSQRWNKSK